jgi:hypothetical protein
MKNLPQADAARKPGSFHRSSRFIPELAAKVH